MDASRREVSGLRAALLAAALVALVVVVRLPFLDLPLERDEGGYAYIAWRLGHGELPYRDWVDPQKPPGVFWVYRLGLALADDPVRGIHAMALLFSVGSALALLGVGRRLVDPAAAALGAALFAVMSADPMIQGAAANTEIFMLLPMLLAHRLFLDVPDGGRGFLARSLGCGALLGVATAFKQVAAVNAVFFLAALPFLVAPGRRLRRVAGFAALAGAGGLAVWGAIAAFFHAHDALGAMLFQVFVHNLRYVESVPLDRRLVFLERNFSSLLGSQGLLWGLALLGLGWVAARRQTRLVVYVFGWTATSAVGVAASGYFFPHYFQQLLPPVALAAAFAATALYRVPAWQGAPAALRAALLAGILAVQPAANLQRFAFRYTPGEATRRIYPNSSFQVMPAVAGRLAQVTDPRDPVFVFGSEPELLFYARRVHATRYIFLFPLYGPFDNAREEQRSVVAELEASPPAAIVYLPNRLFFAPGSVQELTGWVRQQLDSRYEAVTVLSSDAQGRLHLFDASAPPANPGDYKVKGGIYVRRDAGKEPPGR